VKICGKIFLTATEKCLPTNMGKSKKIFRAKFKKTMFSPSAADETECTLFVGASKLRKVEKSGHVRMIPLREVKTFIFQMLRFFDKGCKSYILNDIYYNHH
jgi:ribosomal protein L28